jgi:large subunit ribosomal protein L4
VKRLARKSALTYKANDQRIVIVEDFHGVNAEAPKTKTVVGVLTSLGLAGVKTKTESGKVSKRINKVLMLISKESAVKNENDRKAYENFRKSCRNVPGLKLTVLRDASTYDIMDADYVLFHESALKVVETVFGSHAN